MTNTCSTTRMIAMLAALALALAALACQTLGSDSSTTAVTSNDVLPSTLTVPGRPSGRVTGVAAVELTAEEVEKVKILCKEGAAAPGTNKDCRELLLGKLPCRATSSICLLGGHVTGKPGVAVLRVVDSRPGSPACRHGKVKLCHGVVVDAEVVAPLAGTPTTNPAMKPITNSSSPPARTASPGSSC